ncbi:MAG: hypothetical protein H7293_04955 [Candidatus Saccharibacteria bacterium]|nr:hypothetical protein [Rhodoferax sp.]
MMDTPKNTTVSAKVAAPSASHRAKSQPIKAAARSAASRKKLSSTTPFETAKVQPESIVISPAKKSVSKTLVTRKLLKISETENLAKGPKSKKPKMVRDSMTIPKAEYAVIDELKLRAAKLDRPVKKTELLRAGIKALAAMDDTGFLLALKAVPSLKTGRPSKR